MRTSILVASPPFTMGTVFPACILYGPIECPFRLRIGFTDIINRKKCYAGSLEAQTGLLAFKLGFKHLFKNKIRLY